MGVPEARFEWSERLMYVEVGSEAGSCRELADKGQERVGRASGRSCLGELGIFKG